MLIIVLVIIKKPGKKDCINIRDYNAGYEIYIS